MVDASPPDKKSKVPGPPKPVMVQLVVGLVILVSGLVVGSGGTMMWFKHRGWRPPRRLDGRPQRPIAKDLVERWTTEYGLSTEQAEQIKVILNESMQRRRAVFKASSEKMEAEDVVMVENMKAAMTEEQFEKWHKAFLERKKHHGPRFRGPGRRGPGHKGGPRGFDPNRPRPDGPPPLPPPEAKQ